MLIAKLKAQIQSILYVLKIQKKVLASLNNNVINAGAKAKASEESMMIVALMDKALEDSKNTDLTQEERDSAFKTI